MERHQKNYSKKLRVSLGFTLLEMLMAITIIALLVSMAVQSYKSAKDKARYAACVSYRRQMEIIDFVPEWTYTTDYSEGTDIYRIIDEMVLAYNKCFECHGSANNNDWSLEFKKYER
jgi:prepilin-type N-terminal cleavage/methylation domain-containing protein